MTRRIESVWMIRGPGGRVTECTIHQEADGHVTLRVSHPGADVLHTCRLATIGRARRKAEEWRDTLLALGEFHDLSADER